MVQASRFRIHIIWIIFLFWCLVLPLKVSFFLFPPLLCNFLISDFFFFYFSYFLLFLRYFYLFVFPKKLHCAFFNLKNPQKPSQPCCFTSTSSSIFKSKTYSWTFTVLSLSCVSKTSRMTIVKEGQMAINVLHWQFGLGHIIHEEPSQEALKQ